MPPPPPVDLLIRNADIVTFDPADTILRNAALAILGNRIHWLGPTAEALARFAPRETIDGRGHILMPGFIDCHTHTAQQFLHGQFATLRRRGELKNPVWSRYLVPFEAGLEPEDIYLSGLASYASMISTGTTCFLEAGGPFPDEMGRAADQIGIRGRIALSTMDHGDGIPATSRFSTDDALRRNQDLVLRWQHHPRVNAWLSLRQIMVNTTALTRGMAELARSLDTPIHTHLAEGAYEVDYAIARWGLRPAEYLESLGALDPHLHAAHSVLLSLPELDLYQQRDVSACHCAFNNYTMGSPRLLEMIARNIRLGLGSDGAATRGSLDMFEIVHATVIGQHTVAGTPYHIDTPITHEQVLAQALRGGARAARLDTQLGSFVPGKLADLILVANTSPEQFPPHDPLITLAESTVGPHVQTVIIDGRIVMRDRRILTVDIESMQAKVAAGYKRIMDRFDTRLASQ